MYFKLNLVRLLFVFGGFFAFSFTQLYAQGQSVKLTNTTLTPKSQLVGHSYTTYFPLNENPISENGHWINGGADGIDWTNVSTTSGLAIGHEVGVSYSDGTALLTGDWAPDQAATAVVYSVNQNDACYQEVELRLRSSLSPHSCTGYEINFKASKTDNAYLQIVRWNGPFGDFSYIDSRGGAEYGVETGDSVMATMVGDVITAYINGVQKLQASDTVFKSGNPGIGFNLENSASGCPGTNGDYGFTYFKATDSSTVNPPLIKIGPTGRYLVDADNVPFMVVGDAPQSLMVNLSPDEVNYYFADREVNGFNSVWINLLCNSYTAGRPDGTTYDGIQPFTTPGDISTPNPFYFARIDEYINLAADHNLLVFLDPIETGGWLSTLEGNGLIKSFDYGVYLGNRYKDFNNIIWMSGNDFQSWGTPFDDSLVQAVALGIQSVDHNHIHTAELSYLASTTLDDVTWSPIVSLNAAYTYYPTYAEVLHGYNQNQTTPVFMVEAHYELENVGGEMGTPNVLRRQEYWTMLSGATGQLYGNAYTWQFLNDWKSNIDTRGVTELGYMKNLFSSLPWYSLVPDQNQSIITDGFGTYSNSGNVSESDYATAARTPDGKLIIAYIPTIRTFSIDMANLSGPVTATWFDPTNGVYSIINDSPLENSGTFSFTPPGLNSAQEDDWVLVLSAGDSTTSVANLYKNIDSYISIYPNPLTSSSIVQLRSSVTNGELIIYDMAGNEMSRQKMNGNRIEIDLGNLSAGVYVVCVKIKEGEHVQKMVVQ